MNLGLLDCKFDRQTTQACCSPGEGKLQVLFHKLFDFSVMLQDHSSKVMKLFEDIFGWLPLATVVNKKILVTHGGISNITDLSFIDKIDRHKVRILTFSGPSNLNPNQTLLEYSPPWHPS